MVMQCAPEQIIAQGILTTAEVVWYENARIKHNDGDAWLKFILIQAKVSQAIQDGKIFPEKYEFKTNGYELNGAPNIISDNLGEGVRGLKNMADGKMYDSKSAYRKSLKVHGMVELGNDAPTQGRSEQRGDYNCEADVAKAIKQVDAYKRTGNPDVFRE